MPSRLTISRQPGRLVIEVTGGRNFASVIPLTLWLMGWGAGEWLAARELFFGDELPDGAWMLAVWLLLWTVGGLLAGRALLTSLRGRETLAAEAGTLTLSAGPLGRARRFPLAQVRDLKVEPAGAPTPPEQPPPLEEYRERRSWPGLPAALAFSCGAERVRFGAGLSDGELESARAALAERVAASD